MQLVELIQYEEVSGDGYNPGVDIVRGTNVPSSSASASLEQRTQDDDRVEGGEVDYFVVTSRFGTGDVVSVEAAYSPIGITGDSGSFDNKEISTNGVNMNIYLRMDTASFPWVSGQSSSSRLALHTQLSTTLPLNSQGTRFIMFGGDSGIRHRISWEDEAVSTLAGDDENVNVLVTVGSVTVSNGVNTVDVYFAFDTDIEWTSRMYTFWWWWW
jgi:hypothetical protein